MVTRTQSQPDALLAWMDGLSDPTRLRVLRLLEPQELGVVELCDVLQLPQSTVSRHLRVLTDLGFTRHRRFGTNHLYRTSVDELDPAARKLWTLAREQTDDWSTVAQDALRLEQRLKDRLADSRAFFAGAAEEWDQLRAQLYGTRFSIDAMLAILPAHYIVADLGCGTGELSARLAPYVKQVIGVDNSPAMLKAARKRVESFDNVELKRGELEALPLDDATCDVTVMTLSLSYVTSPSVVMKQTARVLKPQGRAVLVDLLPHDRDDFRRQFGQQCLGFSRQDLERLFVEAGMKLNTFAPLRPEPGVTGPALFCASGTR